MINEAPQGSNSVNGKENTSTLLILVFTWPSGMRFAFCTEGSWGAGSNLSRATSSFVFVFFSFIVFLPFGLFPFIVTADPF